MPIIGDIVLSVCGEEITAITKNGTRACCGECLVVEQQCGTLEGDRRFVYILVEDLHRIDNVSCARIDIISSGVGQLADFQRLEYRFNPDPQLVHLEQRPISGIPQGEAGAVR